jgi:hypothetical protein
MLNNVNEVGGLVLSRASCYFIANTEVNVQIFAPV